MISYHHKESFVTSNEDTNASLGGKVWDEEPGNTLVRRDGGGANNQQENFTDLQSKRESSITAKDYTNRVLGAENLANLQRNEGAENAASQKNGYNSDNDPVYGSNHNHSMFTRLDQKESEKQPVRQVLCSLIKMIPINPFLILAESDGNMEMAALTDSGQIANNLYRKKNRFEVGLTYSCNNTWFVNDETRNSFRRSSLVTTTPTYAASYGFVVNYNVNTRNSLSTEFYSIAKVKQAYGIYMEGRYYDKQIELNYAKVAFLVQRNIFAGNDNIPAHFNETRIVHVGGYASLKYVFSTR